MFSATLTSSTSRMKTEWLFSWKAYDFHFKKEHKFVAKIDDATSESLGHPDGFTAQIRIVPSSDNPRDRNIEQFGDLIITLPFEEAGDLAYAIAQSFGEKIAFRNGDFRVEYGFVSCRRIAETPEEEAEIDGKPYSIRFHLQEVVASPEFDSTGLNELSGTDTALLSEYNDTKRDTNPIRQFLGFFRIIESFSYRGVSKGTLKTVIGHHPFLRRHFASLLPNDDFQQYVNRIVDIRHRCAHLKKDI